MRIRNRVYKAGMQRGWWTQFSAGFLGGFAGKIAAAIVIAGSLAVGLGNPSIWFGWLWANQDGVRWTAVILALVVGVIWFWYLPRRARRIPIAVSRIELRSGGFAGFSDEREKDAWIETFGDNSTLVTITNISTTNKVSLDIWLHATGEKLRIKTLADLSGPFGLILGKDDQGSKGWEKIGREPQVFFRSPVVLAPQETARRRLAFLHNYADLNNPILLARIKSKVTFEIEIIDHVSGGSIRIPIPGEYRA